MLRQKLQIDTCCRIQMVGSSSLRGTSIPHQFAQSCLDCLRWVLRCLGWTCCPVCPGAAPGSDPAQNWAQGSTERPSVQPSKRLHEEPIKPSSLERGSAVPPSPRPSAAARPRRSPSPASGAAAIRGSVPRSRGLCNQRRIIIPFFLWLYSRIKKTAAAFYYLSSLSSLHLSSELRGRFQP